jgi:glycosyltransferase involved in cell wall biosynthesis
LICKNMPLLSVIVPVYNEAKTIGQILSKINALDIDKEIIVIDDGSSDGTDRILRSINYNNLKVIHHTVNRGKGAAFLTGLANAGGEFVIIQDADLEYDPVDYLKLIQRIRQGGVEIVLGARFLKGHEGLLIHRLGNKFLTRLLNMLFRSNLNDYATCYKLASKSTFQNLGLKETGFVIDVEIICNALKRNMVITEVPVTYYPRTYREGKKIRWNDGLWAIFTMFKCRLRRR